MTTGDADALHKLADDLAADAAEFDPTTDHESGVREGLGRAAGKAEARAKELESD